MFWSLRFLTPSTPHKFIVLFGVLCGNTYYKGDNIKEDEIGGA
jgi:hypothetical protein